MRLPSLIPREDRFFGLLRSGAENAQTASRLLVNMLEDYRQPLVSFGEIKQVEELGDHIIHEIMRNLHRTFVTPLDREDITVLADRIDDIVDCIEEGARYMIEYDMPAPTPEAVELARLLERGTGVLVEAVTRLRFRGSKLNEILPLTVEMNRLENEADAAASRGVARLFAEETSAVVIIKWRDIYSQLEAATDRMEDAANVLEGIVLKNA